MLEVGFTIELGPHTLRALKRALNDEEQPVPHFHVVRIVFDTGQIVEGDIKSMVLTDSQEATLSFGRPVTKRGNPAQVDESSISFTISDGSATLTPNPSGTDPYSVKVTAAVLTPVDTPAVITITADADLGDGVKNISGVEPLIVIAGEAAGFGPATSTPPTEQA